LNFPDNVPLIVIYHFYLFIFSQSYALLVLLSLGMFDRVLELLMSMRHFDTAALFVESMKEFGVLGSDEQSSILLLNTEQSYDVLTVLAECCTAFSVQLDVVV
jgi:hypothetical protein